MDALLLFLCLMMMAVFLDYQCVDANEEQGSRLRGLWKLSVKDSKWKTKGLSPPHPIRGPVEQQLLYCQVGIGYHLQILSNGTIGGVHEPNEHSFLKLFAMRRGGVVGIRGIKSGLYLCMSREGVAHGAGQFSSDCLFKESLEENFYTTFSSLSHPGIYLALSHKGEAKRGTSVGRHQTCTHFLPRRAP
ncbi:fibroblast growth factor 4A isoform X2 [Esox lucius]|uniref:fibroblast growth factor 4A isoform X2 n=1 Tax=Esox lucius TaxID=8010 RepID=UPI0009733987|nr:fibroblast growth factor 4A isoform X2 [Esox lucius]